MWGAGAACAAVLAGWAYVTWVAAPSSAITPASAALATSEAATSAAAPAAVAVPSQPVVAAAPPPSSTCDFEPLVAGRDAGDGRFQLEPALALDRSAEAGPFLAVAEEAAAEGRNRDTEVALIAACRIAGRMGARTAVVADVQSRLAQHYAAVAAHADETAREDLLGRAETLLGGSIEAYSAVLGRQASKTRLAQRRLATLRETPVAREQVVQPDASAQERTAGTAGTTSMGAARSSLGSLPPGASEDVGQMDADLQRLYAQANAVSRDRAGLQRRHQQALAARSNCRGDEGCLRQWYAQRKRQLFDEF